ncbi:MAG TPA: nicotinate phosphoribosyltransferase [Steroidobacteraceae bacterium]|nr:nicotinate phosphoribosyltransferase [Steroidobacteraceae bacterium]
MTMPSTPPAAPTLLTDLYQLTMVTAYQSLHMERQAVFEFHVRTMPGERGFLVAAGLQQVLEYLETLRFGADEIAWLGETGRFAPQALDRLAAMRFTGDVDAMPEGTVFFADEPILRVTAPLPEAQFVESRVINLLHFQSMVASKAARCRLAAGSRMLVDFGMRRAHGAEAALLAARACYVAGFDATATVEAGRRFGIPISGTMAHSFIQAHDDEAAAFRNFAGIHPRGLTLLIDTYDTLRAARQVVAMVQAGVRVDAVRLDSGNLGDLAREVRRILDEGGCGRTRIVCSGNLDEFAIARLLASGAPVDSFGVGTRLDVSADAPYLDCAYKLQEYAGRARRKRSPGKATWPGPRQVFRTLDERGRIASDVVGVASETLPGRALLQPAMRAGKVVARPELAEIRKHARRELETLPDDCALIDGPVPVVAGISTELRELAASVDRQFP